MRQWLVNPRFMCTKHLLGEHVETHMFIGCLLKHKSIAGYIEKGLVQPKSIIERHDELVAEMKRRGMKHTSPLIVIDFQKLLDDELTEDQQNAVVDVSKSLDDLTSRCEECRKKFTRLS